MFWTLEHRVSLLSEHVLLGWGTYQHIYFRFWWYKINFACKEDTLLQSDLADLSFCCCYVPCPLAPHMLSFKITHWVTGQVYTWAINQIFVRRNVPVLTWFLLSKLGFSLRSRLRNQFLRRWKTRIGVLRNTDWVYEVSSATEGLFNKPMTAPGNSMLNFGFQYFPFLTNPGTDKVCRESIEFQSSQLASVSKRHPSLSCTNDLHFLTWRNVEGRIMQERQWNHNNTSVSPSPSWGSWVELISHNISKQTLLASLTHTTVPNWLPGVLRL